MTAEDRGFEFVPQPESGRTFTGSRTVSIADAAADGRMSFDAIARFLGDIGNDDTDDAGFADSGLAWVARRMQIVVESPASAREQLTMTTWCSGTGKRWAERRTSIAGSQGAKIEAAALWVHVDPESGRPSPWGEQFADTYLQAAQGRSIDSRLRLPKRPPESDVHEMPWRFRRSDHDVFDHVNNASYLSVLEEALGGHAPPFPLEVHIDWHKPSTCDEVFRVVEAVTDRDMCMWLMVDDDVRAVISGQPAR